ncbi:cysteine-rich venom protein triflin-like [Tubulanus polymorphus]|uniref:cysteine-rich venom protein triflin-like n=1 Tax=Tubulanus polymorphus TaxID=672921 RepID=UPI003DA6012C
MDTFNNAAIRGKFMSGQNMGQGLASWNDVMTAWYNEVKLFTYGSSEYDTKQIGHYTQMVWASTNRIGCGASVCRNDKREYVFYVCNYSPPGNQAGVVTTPYKSGKPSGNCVTGLCDCGANKVCYNSGELDHENCDCRCKPTANGPNIYDSQCRMSCELVPYLNEEAHYVCGKQTFSQCRRLPMHLFPMCPKLCKVCPCKYKTVQSLPV